jgi:2-polyprenyl-3-methyl-5-hydroxy-6-metoxy-1,4-benzoquinol methylase
MDVVHYTACPVCNSTVISDIFPVRDFTVSGKEFLIVECGRCTLRFTQDAPGAQSITAYYKSENYISHTDTSKGLVNRVYKMVRKRTLRHKRKLIEQVTDRRSGTILDVGSGTGAFLHEMRSNGWSVTGLEPDEDAIAVAKKNYDLELMNTHRLYELPKKSYDVITLWHVLEHVHELHACFMQLKDLLTDTGKLIIAVPNYTSLDEKKYKQYWAAYDVPRHLYHFSPHSMNALVNTHGLNIIDMKPMWYDSFYVSLLSSKYQSGNTKWISAMWNGLLSDIQAWRNTAKCSSVIYIISP